jgi:hypothetical protein
MSTKAWASLTVITCLFIISNSNTQIFAAELGDGHNMPMATLGERKALLAYNATQLPTNRNVNLDFTLLDNKTGKNIQHTTYLVTVANENKGISQKPFTVMMGRYLWNLFHQQWNHIA